MLTFIPVLAVLAHLIVDGMGLSIDWLAGHLLSFCFILWAVLKHKRLPSGLRAIQVCALAAVMVWAMYGLRYIFYEDSGMVVGRVCTDVLCGLTCMCIAWSRDGVGSVTRKMLLGSGLGLLATMCACAVYGSPHIGTGYMNSFTAMVAPPIMAGFVWAVLSCRHYGSSWHEMVIPLGFVLALVVWSIWGWPEGGVRRAPLLVFAIGMAIAALATWLAGRRWLSLGCLVLVAGSILLVLAQTPPPGAGQQVGSRSLRLVHWQAAWEGIQAYWPWGGGPFAAVQMNAAGFEHSRWGLAHGEPLDHVHNEFLSVVLEYGLAGLMLAVAAMAGLTWRILTTRDRQRQATAVALGLGLCAMLAVDPAWCVPLPRIWLGAMVGVLLVLTRRSSAPTQDSAAPALPTSGATIAVRPIWQRLTACVLVGVGLVPLYQEMPSLLLRQTDSAQAVMPALERTAIPQVAMTLLDHAAESSMVPNLGGFGEPLTRVALERFGPAAPVIDHRQASLRLLTTSNLMLEHRPHGFTMPAVVLAEARAERPQLLRWWTECTTHYIHMQPLRTAGYVDAAVLHRHGIAWASFGPRVAHRLRLMEGEIVVEAAALTTPLSDFDAAADRWAALRAWPRQHGYDTRFHASFGQLLDAYGLAMGDPGLAIPAISADPQGAMSWYQRHMVLIARWCAGADAATMSTALATATTPRAARMVQSLLALATKGAWLQCEQDRIVKLSAMLGR